MQEIDSAHLFYKSVSLKRRQFFISSFKADISNRWAVSVSSSTFCPFIYKGQKVDEETDSARPFKGKGEFHLLQMKTPIKFLEISVRLVVLQGLPPFLIKTNTQYAGIIFSLNILKKRICWKNNQLSLWIFLTIFTIY